MPDWDRVFVVVVGRWRVLLVNVLKLMKLLMLEGFLARICDKLEGQV